MSNERSPQVVDESYERFYDNLRIQCFEGVHELIGEFISENFDRSHEIIDIATGEGALAKRLIDQGFDVAATTWNDRCKLDIEKFNLNLDYRFSSDDVGNRSYSIVTAVEIIEHVENPSQFLRSCNSVLARNGTLILSTPNIENAQARLQWFVRGYPNIYSQQEIETNRHISMMWRLGLEHILGHAGFEIVGKHCVGTLPPTNFVKNSLYFLMRTFLQGDLRGGSWIYILRKSQDNPQGVGPGNIY